MSIKTAREGFKFGCDPEFFLVTEEGEVVPAVGLIPGTKDEPFKVENGAVQVDGLAAEFNIDPASDFKTFDSNITSVMKQLKAMLPKGLSPHIVPHVRFDKSIMDTLPEEAKVMGCDPDFNAWLKGKANPPPDTTKDPTLRVAAGHVHVGWRDDGTMDAEHLKLCMDLVKQFDWFLGAWSLRHDKDLTRRKLYGQAGSFRPKPYGVEYRTLSNFWINTPAKRLAVWNRMQEAIEMMVDYYYPDRQPDRNKYIQNLINTGAEANWLQEDYRYPLVNLARPNWIGQ